MKSFNSYIQLHEVGNQPYRWKRTVSSKTRWEARFIADNKEKYLFNAGRVNIGWDIIFESLSSSDYGMGITGTQGTSAIRVFSTVANILEAFVKEVEPDTFLFSADKTEWDGTGGRAKLYSRFSKMFAKKNGYDIKELDKRDEIKFVFTRKEGRK